MPGSISKGRSKTPHSRRRRQLNHPDHFNKLFAAGAHATSLGVALLDSQTRFVAVNAALASETRAPCDQHVGKTSGEIVGDLAQQIQPTYERVLKTGKPSSILLEGHVRHT